jgi:hypothetical protein
MVNNPADSAISIKESISTSKNHLWDTSNFFTYGYIGNLIMPDNMILDKYKTIFDQLLIEEQLDPKYYYNPGLFALDKYGSQNLDFVVMYLSGIYSILDFNKPTIKYLPDQYMKSIYKILRDSQGEVNRTKNSPTEYENLTVFEL